MSNNLYKKNKTSLQQEYGRPKVTRALCNEAKSDVKIQINPQIAKQNLQNLKVNLSKSPERLKSLRMLNTDLCRALGIDSNTASHYGGFVIDGFECSIRVSNHNSNAHTYDIDLNNNISLKIRPRNDRNRFIPSESVTLEEFVYFDSMINQDKNLVLDIIDSLIGYLSTGEYVDESGLAKKNYSPDLQAISNQRVQQTLQRKDDEDYLNLTHMGENKKFNKRLINCNRNMRNKKVVRLTESQLHSIIAESVNKLLNEGMFDTAKAMWQGAKDAKALKGQADYYNNNKDSYMSKEGGFFPIADTICSQIENYCKSNGLDDWEVAKSIVGEICRRYRVNGIDYKFDGSIKRPSFTSLDGRNY